MGESVMRLSSSVLSLLGPVGGTDGKSRRTLLGRESHEIRSRVIATMRKQLDRARVSPQLSTLYLSSISGAVRSDTFLGTSTTLEALAYIDAVLNVSGSLPMDAIAHAANGIALSLQSSTRTQNFKPVSDAVQSSLRRLAVSVAAPLVSGESPVDVSTTVYDMRVTRCGASSLSSVSVANRSSTLGASFVFPPLSLTEVTVDAVATVWRDSPYGIASESHHSEVVGLHLMSTNGTEIPVSDLASPIRMSIPVRAGQQAGNSKDSVAVCKHRVDSKWVARGCFVSSTNSSHVAARTYHLTDFVVMVEPVRRVASREVSSCLVMGGNDSAGEFATACPVAYSDPSGFKGNVLSVAYVGALSVLLAVFCAAGRVSDNVQKRRFRMFPPRYTRRLLDQQRELQATSSFLRRMFVLCKYRSVHSHTLSMVWTRLPVHACTRPQLVVASFCAVAFAMMMNSLLFAMSPSRDVVDAGILVALLVIPIAPMLKLLFKLASVSASVTLGGDNSSVQPVPANSGSSLTGAAVSSKGGWIQEVSTSEVAPLPRKSRGISRPSLPPIRSGWTSDWSRHQVAKEGGARYPGVAGSAIPAVKIPLSSMARPLPPIRSERLKRPSVVRGESPSSEKRADQARPVAPTGTSKRPPRRLLPLTLKLNRNRISPRGGESTKDNAVSRVPSGTSFGRPDPMPHSREKPVETVAVDAIVGATKRRSLVSVAVAYSVAASFYVVSASITIFYTVGFTADMLSDWLKAVVVALCFYGFVLESIRVVLMAVIYASSWRGRAVVPSVSAA